MDYFENLLSIIHILPNGLRDLSLIVYEELFALLDAGFELSHAAIVSAKANRMAGYYARTDPATTISQIVEQLPAVFSEHLRVWSEDCLVNK